jgi:2-methylcitrate dehydratase PrpD
MAHSEKSLAAVFSEYAANAELSHFPDSVTHEARRSFVNFVGCALGGLSHELVSATTAAVLPFAGTATASLIGQKRRTDPMSAALINGASASAHSFDDSHVEAVIHPGAPVGAASLAVAETRRVSGADLLVAYALGVEATCRLSRAVSVRPAVSNIAWYQTGICGGVGAAIATAKLLRLGPQQIRSAVGIAISQAGGMRVMQGSMCILLLAGHAAQTGLRAALLAANGFESPADSIEGQYGFCDVFSLKADPAAFVTDLAERYDLLGCTYKAYPCGMVLRPLVDACLRLARDHPIAAQGIERVDVQIDPLVIALTDRPHPRTRSEGQVSLQHWAAVSLVTGRAGLHEGSPEMLADPVISAVRDKVHAAPVPELRRGTAVVALRSTTGKTISCRVETVGAAEQMTDEELNKKFCSQGNGRLPAHRLDRLLDTCWHLDDLPDMESLSRYL